MLAGGGRSRAHAREMAAATFDIGVVSRAYGQLLTDVIEGRNPELWSDPG
jgi:hypothetical protein